MSGSDPQFMYMVLVLPSLFGFTLIGEGLGKAMKNNDSGWISVVFGALFIGVVAGAYLFLAGIV